MKIFKILKRYPSLNEYFQVDDLVYFYPIEDGSYSFKNGVEYHPAQYLVYKKLFHRQKDPFIPKDEVERNPEFFQEVGHLYITADMIPAIYHTKISNTEINE